MNGLSRLHKSRMQALASGTVALDFGYKMRAQAGDGKAHLYIYDVIDDWFGVSSSMVVEALLMAGDEDVVVHVNSPGGQVTEGLAIYNTIKNHPQDVEIRIEGAAFSAASFVALAGNRTVIEPAALMMLHDAWDLVAGNAEAMRKAATTLDKASDTMASIYAGKAGGSAEEWRAVLKAERWYTSQEALDANLVDQVLSGDTQEAQAKWSGQIAAKGPSVQNTDQPQLSADDADWNALRESLKGVFK